MKLIFEPLKKNRFLVTFTEGINISVIQVQKLKITRDFHTIEIMEIVGKPTIFNNIEIDTEVKYTIDLLDPTGKSSETLKFEGKIENIEMIELSYSNDSILTTNILIKLKP